jgi:arsenate reductase (thioredoxin)
MKPKKVLFICVHNSGRSQMAEAYMNAMGGGAFIADSAGFEPSALNPLVVASLARDGLDISRNKPKSVFDLFKDGRVFDYVVTVCDDSREGQCPVFPGVTKRLHVPFSDPAALSGSPEDRARAADAIRDAIKAKVAEFIGEWKQGAPGKLG